MNAKTSGRWTGYLPALGCMLLSATLWAAAPTPPSPPARLEPLREECVPQIEAKVDRFNGVTTATTRVRWVEPVTPTGAVIFTEASSLILIKLIATNDEWQYLDCHMVYMLLDGERFTAEPYRYDGTIHPSGRVSEFIDLELSPEQLRRLASAVTLEGRICNTEFVFPSWFLCDLRGLWTEYQRGAR